jgi:hypothetical protein
MFGRPIYDFVVSDRGMTKRLLARKYQISQRCGAAAYVETSHAFLKSWFDLACDYFPRLKLVHLIRHPLKVAKSEANREQLIKRLRVPFCHYTGPDGQRFFLWSLTGLEPIFTHFEQLNLTRFQWYAIQWIEIENRAMRFLNEFNKHGDCLTLHSPVELNEPKQVHSLFDFLELKRRGHKFVFSGRRNKNWQPTVVSDEDHRQFHEVLEAMPAHYLDIFHREPYVALPWVSSLLQSPTRNPL